MTPPRHRRIARAAMALPLLLLIPPLRHILEASMLTHMLIEFPLLFIAGWLAGGWLTHHRLPAGLPAVVDAHGLLGLALASSVGALWMIPSMLDLSLLDASVQASKYASWTLCGLLFRSSWKRAGPVVSAFFLGNTGWMLATAGHRDLIAWQDAGPQWRSQHVRHFDQACRLKPEATGFEVGGAYKEDFS